MAWRVGVVVFEGVARVYREGLRVVEAVKDATFSVGRGDFAVILGPSGSGKSTVLNIVAGFDRPSRGRAVVLGVDVGRAGWSDLVALRRSSIAYAMQANLVLPRASVEFNIALPLLLRGVGRAEALGRAREVAGELGISHTLDRPAATLSGGELRRLVVARALVVGAGLVLLDEPTSNLDEETSEVVWGVVVDRARSAGSTVVVATHDKRALRYATRVVRAEAGVLREEA